MGFRDVFASREFRFLYGASALSWLGDFIARAAVTALVFDISESVVVSAAAFAISFAPWLLGGYLLVAVAERHPYRKVMIICDVARMLLMALVALPGLPWQLMLVVLLAAALFGPPFDAARSATLPAVLGERYVTGIALNASTGPPIQVLGYAIGAAMALHHPQAALLINAATFGASALLVYLGVEHREPALSRDRRTSLIRETGDGFRLVFTNPALRALILMVFCGSLFAIVPEGLGAAWAARFPEVDRGWAQGLIMGAVPLGLILGSLAVTRLVNPEDRTRLLRPLALVSPAALVPNLFGLPLELVAALALVSGFAIGALVPIANGEFVQALPNAYRARAFGVVQGGLHLLQGTAVLVTGALAGRYDLPTVVGLWSLIGVGLMVLLVVFWPSERLFAVAAETAAAMNQAAATRPPRPRIGAHRAPDRGERPEPTEAAGPPADEAEPRLRGLAAVMAAARRRSAPGQPGTMEP
jgi:MFS family permease